MKTKINKWLICLLSAATILSCSGPEGNLPSGITTGVNARIIFAYPDNTYLNLADIADASLKFDLYSANNDLDKIEYSAKFKSFATGVTSPAVIVLTVQSSSFNGGKVMGLQLSASDLTTALSIAGGPASLIGGDSFIFTAKAYLKDGRTFDATNSSPSIGQSPASSSFTSTFTSYVGCASDQTAIAGNYSMVMTFTDDPGDFPVPSATEDVTIAFKGPEPFRYNLSEITALAYVAFGGQAKGYPGDFFDICGTPTLLAAATQFGTVIDGGVGAPYVDTPIIDTSGAKTKIILNCFETNNQIKWTITLTKK